MTRDDMLRRSSRSRRAFPAPAAARAAGDIMSSRNASIGPKNIGEVLSSSVLASAGVVQSECVDIDSAAVIDARLGLLTVSETAKGTRRYPHHAASHSQHTEQSRILQQPDWKDELLQQSVDVFLEREPQRSLPESLAQRMLNATQLTLRNVVVPRARSTSSDMLSDDHVEGGVNKTRSVSRTIVTRNATAQDVHGSAKAQLSTQSSGIASIAALHSELTGLERQISKLEVARPLSRQLHISECLKMGGHLEEVAAQVRSCQLPNTNELLDLADALAPRVATLLLDATHLDDKRHGQWVLCGGCLPCVVLPR